MAILSKNFFQFFGLEPKLCVDADALQKRFYELSKQWHPDRFTRKSAEEQSEALEATSILNDGYRTLKDPVKRAEYLLKEEGFPIGEQRSKDVPPELLEEVFELNMMLEELKSGDSDARGQRRAETSLPCRLMWISNSRGFSLSLMRRKQGYRKFAAC